MIGIDLDKLTFVTNKEAGYVDGIDSLTSGLNSIINSLSDAYSGVTLNSVASILDNQCRNLESIKSLHMSYLLLLQSVKKSYVAQEEVFSQQLKNKL